MPETLLDSNSSITPILKVSAALVGAMDDDLEVVVLCSFHSMLLWFCELDHDNEIIYLEH